MDPGARLMGLLHNLKLRFSPPRRQDPEFGELLFIYIQNAPERSYWEAKWRFPPTDTSIDIDLLGPESGPLPEARSFYHALPFALHVTPRCGTTGARSSVPRLV